MQVHSPRKVLTMVVLLAINVIASANPQKPRKMGYQDSPYYQDLQKLLASIVNSEKVPRFTTRSGIIMPNVSLYITSPEYLNTVYPGKTLKYCLVNGVVEYKVNPIMADKKWRDISEKDGVIAAILSNKACVYILNKKGELLKTPSRLVQEQFVGKAKSKPKVKS